MPCINAKRGCVRLREVCGASVRGNEGDSPLLSRALESDPRPLRQLGPNLRIAIHRNFVGL